MDAIADWNPTPEQIEACKPSMAAMKARMDALKPETLQQMMNPGPDIADKRAANFAEADADKDGLLSKDECWAYHQLGYKQSVEKWGEGMETTKEEADAMWEAINAFDASYSGITPDDINKYRKVGKILREQA